MGAFSPGSEGVVTASHEKTVRGWNETTGRVLFDLAGCRGSVRGAVFDHINQLTNETMEGGKWHIQYCFCSFLQ
jgi:hypothetical protein